MRGVFVAARHVRDAEVTVDARSAGSTRSSSALWNAARGAGRARTGPWDAYPLGHAEEGTQRRENARPRKRPARVMLGGGHWRAFLGGGVCVRSRAAVKMSLHRSSPGAVGSPRGDRPDETFYFSVTAQVP